MGRTSKRAVVTAAMILAVLGVPRQADACFPDFDDDGAVGFTDFIQFTTVFGSASGDERYDAVFDLDRDGTVGFFDFLTFAGYFGKKAPSHREVLGALYDATGGPSWNVKENWLGSEPLGDWHGVRTDENGRVTELSLGSNGLTGRIPVELCDLRSLEYLNLSWNNFEGGIPAELGRLGSLEYLNLSVNSLEGGIPVELGDLTSLEYLNFSWNNLEGGIPAELGNLTSLEYLNLSRNRLEGGIPAELGNLANLTDLWLSRNPSLTGPLPSAFTGLNRLEYLSLFSTQLCVPTDDEFQAWLNGRAGELRIESGAPCGS